MPYGNKNPSDYMHQAPGLLALHLLPLARLSNNKQVNRLEVKFIPPPTFAKLSNMKVKFHPVLQVSNKPKKKSIFGTLQYPTRLGVLL
jgi:hypothetical protein